MAIRWEQIQNLSVTEDEINLLAGLTATAAELNQIAGFTGTAADLNDLIGLDVSLAAHEALDFTTAHPIVANTLDGLLLVDGTVSKVKMAFNVADDTDIAGLQVQVDDVVSDTVVQQTQIDNLFGIVIPGQGSDISDAIDQTIAHIEKVEDAHDASAISYGNYYALPSDITAATTTTLTLPASIIKFFRAGESVRFQDDVTPAEDIVLTTVNYTTNEITFPVTVNGYTILDNGIIWTLAEDQVQEGLDRSFRNDGETELVLREGIYKGTLDTQTLTADRTWTLRDEDLILGNPAITGNGLNVLRVNAGATDVEWHDLTAADIDFNNVTSGLTATDVQAAIDELDGIVDSHIADGTIHFTEASIDHTAITNIGTNSHAAIDTHISDATLHRIINDAGTSATELWSASKINTELAGKSDTSHNHTLDALSNVDGTGKVSASILEWNGTDTWIVGTKGEINTVSNLAGDQGVFATKVGSDLRFKSISAGSNISLIADANSITITAAAGLGEANTASNVGGANGVFKQKTVADLEFKTLAAGANMTITPVGDTLEFASSGGGGGGGTAITRNQVAHGFTILDGIYHDGSIWQQAQADDAETLAEYVVTEVTDVDNFVANKFGEVTVAAHGKTVGEHYFLSDSVAGGSQITEPADFSSTLFYAEDANTIHVEVYRPSEITELISDATKWQKKYLTSDQGAGAVADLQFNNLETGRTYKLYAQAVSIGGAGTQSVELNAIHNGSTIMHVKLGNGHAFNNYGNVSSTIFIAAATTVTFNIDDISSAGLKGNSTDDETWAILEEAPTHTVTTDWT